MPNDAEVWKYYIVCCTALLVMLFYCLARVAWVICGDNSSKLSQLEEENRWLRNKVETLLDNLNSNNRRWD